MYSLSCRSNLESFRLSITEENKLFLQKQSFADFLQNVLKNFAIFTGKVLELEMLEMLESLFLIRPLGLQLY